MPGAFFVGKEPAVFDITQRNISGCGLTAMMSEAGERVSGEAIINSIALLHDRSNGMGGGFAAYGIYPQRPDDYALHLMYYGPESRDWTERVLDRELEVRQAEPIPTRAVEGVPPGPALWRYFVQPGTGALERVRQPEPAHRVAKTVAHQHAQDFSEASQIACGFQGF
jgi:glutamate synthase domain-containing protein 1